MSLTDQADGYVIADAVMFLPPGAGPNSAVWTPNVAQAGQYEVYARWTQHANRASDATYTVTHSGGATAVPVNQQANGGVWNLLGTFALSPGTEHKVTLTDQANGYVIADAIRLVPVAVQAEQKLYFVHTDHLNTPRLVADATGTTVWRWDQAEPFGNNPANEDPDANSVALDLPLRLPGQRYDAETALHYNMARDYWPDGGRYVQSDPLGVKADLNTYAYVAGDPLHLIDPTGEDIMCGPGRNKVGTNPDGSVRCVDNGRGPNEKVCATAACAAGIGPLPSENRPEWALNLARCTWTCKVVLTPPMACLRPSGIWWFDMPSKSIIKGGVCDWVCD